MCTIGTEQSSIVMANLTNTGTEIISDFKHMDVLVYDQELMAYEICTYDETGGTAGTWNIANRFGEFIHPYSLDPGEAVPDTDNVERGPAEMDPGNNGERGLCVRVPVGGNVAWQISPT